MILGNSSACDDVVAEVFLAPAETRSSTPFAAVFGDSFD